MLILFRKKPRGASNRLPRNRTPEGRPSGGRTPEEIRNVLGGLGLIGEGHVREINSLSGGERTRVALSQLILEDNNFLFLDEPTNHLDVESASVLSDALGNFDGSMVLISHDRELIENCATHFLIIQNQKTNLYDRIEPWMFEPHIPIDTTTSSKTSKTQTKMDYNERKSLSNKLSKARKNVKKTEQEIEELEHQIELFDIEMNQDGLPRSEWIRID